MFGSTILRLRIILMVGPSRSILFQTLMGERYLVGDLEGEYPGYQFQSSFG